MNFAHWTLQKQPFKLSNYSNLSHPPPLRLHNFVQAIGGWDGEDDTDEGEEPLEGLEVIVVCQDFEDALDAFVDEVDL